MTYFVLMTIYTQAGTHFGCFCFNGYYVMFIKLGFVVVYK